jgi:hypothetical protein
MGIIDSGDMDALVLTGNCFRLVEQHSDTYFLQVRHHADRVVVT